MSLLDLEYTLALIKPHAIHHRAEILEKIKSAGFHVLQERCVKLTNDELTRFKCNRLDEDRFFTTKLDGSQSGTFIALCLCRTKAVELWQRLMGPENCSVARKTTPESLRAIYGDVNNETLNALDGSRNSDDVRSDLQFFFPNIIHEPILSEMERINAYLNFVIYKPLIEALYEMIKIRPDDPILWLANFMLERNKIKSSIQEMKIRTSST
ncbi:CLUMA_CG007129, isoform A [Clunio marinus]|uniref:CLUMA_CG007129, isoform A n=1 Tax=Clunio marinus TaxID=568069 RepID=A0A1J1I1X9_9DIPT|nr:CLUMA_CG007129, isoform A [Clunio marinus]